MNLYDLLVFVHISAAVVLVGSSVMVRSEATVTRSDGRGAGRLAAMS